LNRRPAHLGDGPEPQGRPKSTHVASERSKSRSVDEEILRSHLAGRHELFGFAETQSLIRRVVAGTPEALLGMDRFSDLTDGVVEATARHIWGWSARDAAAWTDPNCTIAGMRAALLRILDVSRRGGLIAFATGRPASLLPLYADLARLAASQGAEIFGGLEFDDLKYSSPEYSSPEYSSPEYSSVASTTFSAAGHPRARLVWQNGVALVESGGNLISDAAMRAADALFAGSETPDLVVADRGFAGTAIELGSEVVAFADLDAIALGVAAARGLPVTIVPVQEQRPPHCYRVLSALADVSGDGLNHPL